MSEGATCPEVRPRLSGIQVVRSTELPPIRNRLGPMSLNNPIAFAFCGEKKGFAI